MTHTGVLAQNVHGAAQCFVTYCEEGARRLGSHTYPDITVDYIAFGHTMAAAAQGPDAVRSLVGRSVTQLRDAGADFFVCADNTAHLALDLPGDPLDLPGLHLAQLVAEEARRRGYRRVGLLGTALLVSSAIYPAWLGTCGIATEVPDPADLHAVDRIVVTELVDGVAGEDARRLVLDVIARLADRGCDAVVLASTELPSLFPAHDGPLPWLDSADIAARAALDVALGERPRPTWRGGLHPDLATVAA